MKAGDKLYCTTDADIFGYIFKKGKIYDLLDNKHNDKDLTVCLIDENYQKLTFHHKSPLFRKLSQHFITQKEVRKLKLNKLNECK